MLENTGSAILIIGAIWLHLAYGLDIVWTVFICAFGFLFWLTIDSSYREKVNKLEIEKKRLELELLKAKIQFYERKGAEKVEG